MAAFDVRPCGFGIENHLPYAATLILGWRRRGKARQWANEDATEEMSPGNHCRRFIAAVAA
jgi:hypothetical protein